MFQSYQNRESIVRQFVFVCVTAALTAGGNLATAQLIQPDSATASSEFSGAYLITNTINGSGLPAGFGPDAVHNTYLQNNHWTTRSGALQNNNAFANFFFDDPTTIGTMYLWNHLSNGVAADPGYAVTLFDLRYYGAGDVVLFESLDTVANPVWPPDGKSQAFDFPMTDGVVRVEFVIRANRGSPQYTGFAEIAFSPIPAPGTAAVLGCIGFAAARRRRV